MTTYLLQRNQQIICLQLLLGIVEGKSSNEKLLSLNSPSFAPLQRFAPLPKGLGITGAINAAAVLRLTDTFLVVISNRVFR